MLKLVYVCLAVSAVALTALVVSSASQGPPFRGTTAAMARALQDQARILDADETGAITQTGNGIVAGFRRGETEPDWEIKFARFPDSDRGSWDTAPGNAAAWCAGDCPGALVQIGSRYQAHGGAAPALAEKLNTSGSDAYILDILSPSGAFARIAGELTLLRGQDAQTLPVKNPSVAIASGSGRRVIAGSAVGQTGLISRTIQDGGKWKATAPTLSEPNLQNLCISPDGRWVGATSHRLLLMSFVGSTAIDAGNPISAGVCRADSTGFTFAVNPPDDPSRVSAVRFTHDGRRLWARSFGAQRLLSPSGLPVIVTRSPDNTVTVVDATTGQVRFKHSATGQVFVGDDGAIVTADRAGQPEWMRAPH